VPIPSSGNRPRGRGAAAGLALALLAAALPAAAAVTVERLQLEMGPLDGEVLLRKDPNDQSTFAVTVVDPADGKRLPGRISVKGAFTRELAKKSLLIKLDDGHKWRGSSRISLNAMATDGSYMREWLSWKMMKALRMAVPEVDYVALSLNGRELGAYLRIEWIDGAVFDRHRLGKDGDYFQPLDATYCGDLSLASIAETDRCWRNLARGDYQPLETLVRDIDAATPVSVGDLVEQRFEPEALVNWLAVNALVSDSDVYNKNYFLYRSKAIDGRWVVVPFDYDITFGRTYDPYRTAPYTIINDNFSYYYPLALGAPNPLRTKAIMNERIGARVRARIGELIDRQPGRERPWQGWFEPARMDARIDELYERLRPMVDGDPERFRENVDAVRHYVRARVQYLNRVILGRATAERDRASARLPQHRAITHLVDGAGFLVGYVRTAHAPAGASVTLETIRGRPELVPPELSADACVQRAWRVTAQGAGAGLPADLTLEYRQETSRDHELGGALRDERRLVLYRRDVGHGTQWRALRTEGNALANTLTVRGMTLPAGPGAWFAACEAAPTFEARAAG
jgi:spore coat protein CotH